VAARPGGRLGDHQLAERRHGVLIAAHTVAIDAQRERRFLVAEL
jgi:hypothetical protein